MKISVRDFCDIINADNHGLPPYLARAEKIIAVLMKVNGRDAPPELRGKDVGKWIRAERIRRFVTLKFFREEI